MVAFKLLLAATVSGIVTAWPEPTAVANLDNRAIDCSKLTGCLGVLKKIGPPASTFCRSYLKVPGTKTSTTTITPIAITSTTSTTTVTVTSSVCGNGLQKRGESHDLENPSVEDIEKRTNVLPLLAAFAAAKISEGCSCLNLKPTATQLATFTAPATTVNVVATTTSCVVAQPPPPVCKNSGLQASCSQGSECCTGRCGTEFGSSTCCNASNTPCDLGDPGSCCSGICYGPQNGIPAHCG
ncbi:hypothetical protein HBI25_062070 [Parastagonospora nodorum]|nr:hypothetical protein HBH52_072150 [Parastagonospora nodorum]KAH4302187.1 hypothetical protein HBI02_141260 [Parastagonospora nodorum]KAH4374566.1 hypothetical protein HBH94_104340 [Parastagonospora nodorum]KAH4491374.1 hypothetical protein HBH88_115210 [Parastagonospora nodorum]KAH4686302.1 hypothetical protein HBH79_070500 [Parastagonospora nodorum]